MYKPESSEFDNRLSAYIDETPDIDLITLLSDYKTLEFYKSIPESKYGFKYAKEKWSIKEIISHIIDGERIFSFRSLWFARNNKTALPGYDENHAANFSNASERNYLDLLEEYESVRKSSIYLFKSFTPEMLNRVGHFDNKFSTVRAMGYLIAGHELHHQKIIKERYL